MAAGWHWSNGFIHIIFIGSLIDLIVLNLFIYRKQVAAWLHSNGWQQGRTGLIDLMI